MTTTLTPRERELARHALGLDLGSSKALSNSATPKLISDDAEVWKGMVAKGLAQVGTNIDWGFFRGHFRLTRAGALAALEEGEELCEEDFPR